MARGRRSLLLMLILAALAIVGGTAATLFSGRTEDAPTQDPSEGARDRGPWKESFRAPTRGPEPPRQPATLTVQVLRASDDAPIAGATVTVEGGPEFKVEAVRTTGGDGYATIADFPSGVVGLLYEAPDYEPEHGGTTLQPGANPMIQVRLQDSAVVEGRVVAAADGTPVAGARVEARRWAASNRVSSGDINFLEPSGRQLVGRVATTDPDGRFHIRAGRPGMAVPLLASAPGFAGDSAVARVPDAAPLVARVEIRLEREGRIRGTVRDSLGRPVAGAHVSAGPAAYARPFGGTGGGISVGRANCVSGADGSYSIEGVAVGGVYEVQAYREPAEGRSRTYRAQDGRIHLVGRLGGEGLSFPVEVYLPPDPGEATADLVVPGWGRLSVVWRSAVGPSDGAARVIAFSLDAPTDPPEIVPGRRGATGFELHLRAGRWRIVVDSERHGCGEAEAVVVGDGESRIEVTVGTAPSFEGVVVDGDGRGVPGVVVEAAHANDGAGPFSLVTTRMPARRVAGQVGVVMTATNRWTTATAHTPLADSVPGTDLRGTTDAAGRFLIDGLHPGSRWRLFVRGDVLSVPATDPIEAPSREIRLLARRSGAVEGRVALPPGVPVPPTRSLHFQGAEGALPGVPSLRSTAGFADGRFRLERLPPGPGKVWAETDGLRSPPVEVVVPEGGTVEVGDLALEPAPNVEAPPPPVEPAAVAYGTLSATARDPSGRPLAGWWIGTRPGSATTDPWKLHGRVDYRGAFASMLPAGEHRVALFAPDAHEPAAETSATVPDKGEVSVDFRAER